VCLSGFPPLPATEAPLTSLLLNQFSTRQLAAFNRLGPSSSHLDYIGFC
jgi:hypothetical protein